MQNFRRMRTNLSNAWLAGSDSYFHLVNRRRSQLRLINDHYKFSTKPITAGYSQREITRFLSGRPRITCPSQAGCRFIEIPQIRSSFTFYEEFVMLASPKPNSTLISRIFRKTLYSMEKVSFFCLVAIAGPVNAQNTTTAWSAAVRTAAGEPIAGAKVTVPRLRSNNKQL